MLSYLLSLAALAAAIWVIYDVLVNQSRMSGALKAVWIICAVFFSLVTGIVYFLVVKKGKL